MIKCGTYVDLHVQAYICTKFGDFNLENEPVNAKRARLMKWPFMRKFIEAEPSWSNSSEILGQWMPLLSLKMIRENLRTWER